MIEATVPLTVKIVILPDQKKIDNLRKDPIESSTLPKYWTKSRENQVRFVVNKTTDEYTTSVNDFNLTMKGKYVEILKIERIQKEGWFIQYTGRKKDLKNSVNDDKEGYIDFAGLHGVLYGQGVYFSTRAFISHSYTIPNYRKERCTFLACVIIGRTTLGSSDMKMSPQGYHSTTDGNHIFVICHDAQAYPEYLITYK